MKRINIVVILSITFFAFHQTARADKYFFEAPVSFHVNGGIGFPFGPMLTEERESVEVVGYYEDGEKVSDTPHHVGFRLGPRIDITPFNWDRLKLGLRVGYDISAVRQSLSVGDESWGGRLMRDHAIPFGPILYFGRQRTYTRAVYGTAFLLNGPILGGDYNAAPAAKDFGELDGDIGKTSYRGWRFCGGIGFGGAFSNLLMGMDISYSHSLIKLKEEVYVEVDKNTYVGEIIFNFHLGVFIH